MIILEKRDFGATLTTWIYCMMWQLWAAEQQGKYCYVNWPKGKCLRDLADDEKFKKNPNLFEWYFKQPHKNHENDIIEIDDYEDTWLWETWVDPSPVSFMAQPLEVIKDYYKKHLKFSDEVETRGNWLQAKYKINFSETIGITW